MAAEKEGNPLLMRSGMHDTGVGGIVLCGGESRRMGRSKPGLRFGDEFLLQRVVRIVCEKAHPVVAAARRGMELPALPREIAIVYDQSQHAGPLAGMAAGMHALQDCCEAVVVVGCDHPFVTAEVLNRMIELLGDHQGVIPEREGTLTPTLGVYRLTTLPLLDEMLRAGERRAQRFAARCRLRRIGRDELADIDPDLKSLCSVNDPVEFEAAIRAAIGYSPKEHSCER